MYYLKVALIAALALAAAPGPAQRGSAAPGAPPDHPFAQPLWDDGRAEVSVYGGTTLRYGQLRPTTAHLIVVKEDLLRESLVKSDSGPVPGRTLTAIKYNFIADFPTGTYTYHQMATVMFDRRDLTVLKETMSHTEGCGITFVRIGPQHGAWMHEAHSYWEGEADRAVAVEWPEGPRAFADALRVGLRGWTRAGAPAEFRLWMMPAQVSGRSPVAATRPIEARITGSDGGTVRVPAGAFPSRVFRVVTAAGTDTLWFDANAPHVMLKMATAAGRRLELRKTRRLDYWKHTQNGDERLLE